MKVNKKLILMLVLILLLGILNGCASGDLPKGVENKKFLKDMSEIHDIVLKSMSEQKYYEDDINKVLDNMGEREYKEKLNDYELTVYEFLLEVLVKVKEDLTTGKKMIQSTTLEEVKLIKEMLNN